MRRRGPVAAITLVLVTNAYVLIGVAWNRSGEPDAEITLTERELPLHQPAGTEASAPSLRLAWAGYLERGAGESGWLDERKLEEIGFDCEIPLASTAAPEFYRKQLPRMTYVVLENGGKAWEERLERLRRSVGDVAAKTRTGDAAAKDLETERKRLERSEKSASRLVPMDAGNDAAALRSKYADRTRYVIVQGIVRITTGPSPAGARRREEIPAGVQGSIQRLLISEIDVPAPWRSAFGALGPTPADGAEPRFAVTLRFGRRHEPWIVDVQLLPPPEGGRAAGQPLELLVSRPV